VSVSESIGLAYQPQYLHTIAVSATTMLVYWQQNTTGAPDKNTIYGVGVRYSPGTLELGSVTTILAQDPTYLEEPFSGYKVAPDVAGFSIDEQLGSTQSKVVFVHVDPDTLALTPFTLPGSGGSSWNNASLLMSDGDGRGVWLMRPTAMSTQNLYWFTVDGAAKSSAIVATTTAPTEFVSAMNDAENDRQSRYTGSQIVLRSGAGTSTELAVFDIDFAANSVSLATTISGWPKSMSNDAHVYHPGTSSGRIWAATQSISPTESHLLDVDLATGTMTEVQTWAFSLGVAASDIRTTRGHMLSVCGQICVVGVRSSTTGWDLRTSDGRIFRIDEPLAISTGYGSGAEELAAGAVFTYVSTQGDDPFTIIIRSWPCGLPPLRNIQRDDVRAKQQATSRQLSNRNAAYL
jgi:hypothetical protein